MSDIKRDVISINQNGNKNVQPNGVVIGFLSGNPTSRNFGCNKKVAMNVSVRVEEGGSTLPTDTSPGNHW